MSLHNAKTLHRNVTNHTQEILELFLRVGTMATESFVTGDQRRQVCLAW